MVSVKTRIKFTRAVVAELGAFFFLLLIAFGLFAMVLIPFMFGEFSGNENLIISGGFESILVIVILLIAYFAVVFWRKKDYGKKIKAWEAKGRSYSVTKLILTGAAAGLLLWLFNIGYELFIENFITGRQVEYPLEAYGEYPKSYRLIIFLLAALAIPVAEELFFRRYMFGNILRRGFPKTAYIFSTLIFGLFHFDLPNIIVYLAYGFIFALLYERTRSIVAPVAAHIVLNLLAFRSLLY